MLSAANWETYSRPRHKISSKQEIFIAGTEGVQEVADSLGGECLHSLSTTYRPFIATEVGKKKETLHNVTFHCVWVQPGATGWPCVPQQKMYNVY